MFNLLIKFVMQKILNQLSRKTRCRNIPRTVVQNGLAVTPSEMLKSCNMGVPISSQLLSESNFDDGEVSQLTDVPFVFRRGVDVGDVIAYEEQCRSKVSNAYAKLQQTS